MLLLVLAVDWLSRLRSFQFFGQSVDRVETAAKAVAMTFDDGPNPPYTEEILAILDRYSVKATFFLVGKHIRSFPDTARRISEAGHDVGNHSFSHRRLVYEYPHSIRREMLLTDRILESVGIAEETLFRAPYCRKLFVLPYELARTNRLHVAFDVPNSPLDCFGAPAGEICRSVLSQVRPGSIIVLHDGSHDRPRDRSNVVAATRLLLKELMSQGYRLVTVRELLQLGGSPRRHRRDRL